MYILRALNSAFTKAAGHFPAVLLTGPRQSGKSTFTRHVLKSAPYITFDDPLNRDFATKDPNGFLDQFNGRQVILDEIQYVPTLLQYVKIRIDRDRRPGLWIMTASQQSQEGTSFEFCAATIGNPHCIILSDNISPELARQYGPIIETHPLFPNRTNVQFLKVIDRRNIQIEIWERGAGYTLASGSSSTAAAAVAHKLGLCDSDITVHMPGGNLALSFSKDFIATMTGPVTRVCEGKMDPEMFEKTD